MKLCLLTLSLLVGWSVQAEQVYLLFTPECGQQLRYRRSVEQAPAPDYFTYVFADELDGARYLLETDAQGSRSRSTLPDSYLSCGTAVLSARMIERINAGTDQLTLLVPSPDGGDYQVQPVVMAAVMQRSGDQITYSSPLATFAFDTRLTVIGEDLDRAHEGATVYFEGREGADDCQESYLFVQHHASSAYPAITYRISPTLGILERSMEGNGTYGKSEQIIAVAANGVPMDTYLAEHCAEASTLPSAPVTDFVPYYVEPVLEDVAPSPNVAPATAADPEVRHRVQAGETLYQLSRRYGVAVSTLRALNGLEGNTIFVGQELLMTQGDTYLEAAPGKPAPAVAQPSPAVAVAATSSVVSGDYHVVQAGETIASLALRFGYTEARFREFNGIADQPVALVGQRLRTSHCSCPAEAEAPPTEQEEEQEETVALYSPPPPPPSLSPPDFTPIVVPPARPVLTEHVSDRPVAVSTTALPPAYGGGRTVHVVQEGQSLYAIARQYGVSVGELQQLNGLGPSDVIVPFQKLYVN
ncbi:LysM peptidoglycan-binding domain-containing protein [Neolewinella sp.]|uniref:LysM peptidoglycan-binding domain-containing protein n=1 Tax=Neolewinella sp. TaxID=2993543 RepID=UPI003B51ADFE